MVEGICAGQKSHACKLFFLLRIWQKRQVTVKLKKMAGEERFLSQRQKGES